MTEHFIKDIEIKDFKCFSYFEAEGFTRVNLIGGKNNIGKTALMEAMLVNVYAQDIKSFITSLDSIVFMRENINILSGDVKHDIKKFIEISDNIFVKSNINSILYKIDENDGEKNYIFKFKDGNIKKNVNKFSFDRNIINNIQFIDNYGFTDSTIRKLFSPMQIKNKEEILNKILNKFDSNIENFKVISSKPSCQVNGKYLKISQLGYGTKHLISIVIALYASENGYLFIDEIDNGIHYTQLDDIWELILKVSEELNVQVFATTHSKECLESFNRVQLEIKDDKTSYFEMAKNIKANKIFMRALDANQLSYELSHKGRYRGE